MPYLNVDTRSVAVVKEIYTPVTPPNSASLINTQQPFTGAVSRTQADKNTETISILDFIPSEQHAAIFSRTSSYNCMPALTAAIGSGRRVVIPRSGKYVFTTAFNSSVDVNIHGSDQNITLDFTGITGNYGINSEGSVTQLADATSDISEGTSTITLGDAAGINAGDWFAVWNPADYSLSGFREYYRAGEYKQVLSKSGNTLTTTQPFTADYTAATVDVYKLNTIRARISNVEILGDSSVAHLVRFALADTPVFDNVRFNTAAQSALFVERCVRPTFINCAGANLGQVGGTTDYGILISNCQHARVNGGDIYGRRHAIGAGGNNNTAGVPVRDMRIRGAILRNDPAQFIGAADFHGNVGDSSYEDCTIYGSTNIGGIGDNYFKRCTIYSDPSIGRATFSREVKGGRFGFIDCTIYCYNNPQLNVNGVFDIGGNSDVLTSSTTDDFTFIIKDCVVSSKKFGAATQLVLVRNAGTNAKLNFIIDGLELNVNDLYEVLRTSLTTGTAASDFIIVQGVTGFMPTNSMITHIGGHYLNFPHRVQAQGGKIALTTIAQAITSAPTQVFKFKYPRTPQAKLALIGDSNYGGQIPLLHTIALTNSTIRPQIKAAAAMTAGDAFGIDWEVGLWEC